MNWLRSILDAVFGRYYQPWSDTTRTRIRSSLQDARHDWNKCTREEQVRLIRHFEQTTDIVPRLADLFECYTVGTGLPVHPASSDSTWNAQAKVNFGVWERNADLVSRQSFGTLCSMIARAWFIDGECFVIKTVGDSGRPRLQVVESHRCKTPWNRAHEEGDSIVDGVEIDAVGRPVGYFFLKSNSHGREEFTRYKADDVEHVWEPNRAGQYRGIPFLASVLRHLHDLDDLQAYEMLASKDAAEKSNVLTTDSGEFNPNLMAKFRGTSTSVNVAGSTVTQDRADYVKQAIGGRTIALRKGESVQQFPTARPTEATRALWRYLKESICCGAGIPYVVAYPESMQGTVFRGALDAADAFFRARSVVIQDFIRRIYSYVMPSEFTRDPKLRSKPQNWPEVTIHPPRSINVDVGYNSAAAIAELEAGLATYDMIYGPRGLDWRQQFDRLAEQQQYALQKGLILTVGNTDLEAARDQADRQTEEENATA